MEERAPIQTVAMLVGAVFLLLGILGFVPGVTSHYGVMTFAGHGSGAKLFGVFQVSVLHNIVHLMLGLAGVSMAKTHDGARSFLLAGGIVSALLFLYGLAFHGASGANWLPVNTADNILHGALGAGMIALAYAFARRDRAGGRRVAA
jgi:arginine exporter protein ArgO